MATSRSTPKGLPRPRGDRPRQFVYGSDARSAPPPTRGSTRVNHIHIGEGRGSPAHAGIDPCSTRSARAMRWLPRPRGDRPGKRSRVEFTHQAPPPTRGSTLAGVGAAGHAHGSPAHAGIDPPRRPSRAAPSRLPRPRGDRPAIDRLTGLSMEAPPPTRGSTLRENWIKEFKKGSPAHAGIDPRSNTRSERCLWLPRPRGDRPFVHHETALRAYGSPAHAGIDPARSRPASFAGRLPRPRGDRPPSKRSLQMLWRGDLGEKCATIWMRIWCRGGYDDCGVGRRAQVLSQVDCRGASVGSGVGGCGE